MREGQEVKFRSRCYIRRDPGLSGARNKSAAGRHYAIEGLRHRGSAIIIVIGRHHHIHYSNIRFGIGIIFGVYIESLIPAVAMLIYRSRIY